MILLENCSFTLLIRQEPGIFHPLKVWCFDQGVNQKRGRVTTRSFVAMILLANVILIANWGCSSLPERLKTSQLNSEFIIQTKAHDSMPFSTYIERSKDIIRKARVDLNSAQNDQIINANAPFEYRPDSKKCTQRAGPNKYENGILLIHGLTASPYIMQDLGEFFRAHCFLVRAVLLPGHGTRPGDLLDIQYQDWVKAIEYGAQSFNGQVKNLYLSGYSIGGALAVHHALAKSHTANGADNRTPNDNQEQGKGVELKGLILFSPALKPKSNLAFLAGTVSLFSDWMSTANDRDYAAYESFPYNAAAQSYEIIEENKNRFSIQKNFPVPVFIALSEDDETVDSKHTINLFRQYLNNGPNQMQLYTTHPQSYSSDLRIEALQSQIGDENIISFSHTSLTVPGSHSHYGMNGDYQRCLHYPEQSKKWLACTSKPDITQAETSESMLKEHTIRQLTYNAHFSRMLNAMDHFLEQLGVQSTSQVHIKTD